MWSRSLACPVSFSTQVAQKASKSGSESLAQTSVRLLEASQVRGKVESWGAECRGDGLWKATHYGMLQKEAGPYSVGLDLCSVLLFLGRQEDLKSNICLGFTVKKPEG